MGYNASMDDFIPFFTNDGSVGLFSQSDNDIYHSVYGALSEAYDKFVFPIDLENYLKYKSDINVLDICYGIGYNSKTFIDNFIKLFLRKKKYIFTFHAENNDSIYTDNILNDKCIKAIGTNNIFNLFNQKTKNNVQKKSVNFEYLINNICKNDSKSYENEFYNNSEKNNAKNNTELNNFNNNKYRLNIDAVDIDSQLVLLSPFFKEKRFNFKKNKTGILKIDKYLNYAFGNQNRYRLLDESKYIILKYLIDDFGEEKILDNYKKFVSNPVYEKFIDKNMADFMKFCSRLGYKYFKKENKSTFLHNIYYRYVSYRYKNHLNELKNPDISLKFHINDARQFVLNTNKKYDFIFLDAFTPAKCPALWTYDFFYNLYNILSDGGIILTYTSSAAVRNAMIKNNFYIGNIFNQNENKFTGTLAAKNKNAIVYPLSEYDKGLLETKAGIVYRDAAGDASNSDIINLRIDEANKSNLQSATQYIKRSKQSEI